ncbi:hypothetical protein PATA110616_16585 [Paenibacillus tarimensis]
MQDKNVETPISDNQFLNLLDSARSGNTTAMLQIISLYQEDIKSVYITTYMRMISGIRN